MVFGRTPRMPFEIELGIPLSSPSQHTDYTRSTRCKLQAIHTIARANLDNSRKRQDKRNAAQHPCWKPFPQGQAVWLKRPKKWKFGPKWVGTYTVLERLGVNYKLKSQDGEISIVHHDNLKLSRIPCGQGKIAAPTPESGNFYVVEPLLAPPMEGGDETRGTNNAPRVRPVGLRQNVQPPKRFGIDD